MDLKLNFDNPAEISQNGIDRVRISFRNTTLMFDWTGQEMRNDTVIERVLPPQYNSNLEAKIFGSIEEAFTTYETGSFHGNVVVNAMIAGIAQHNWSQVTS